MNQGATGPGHSRLAYPGTLAMLALAFAFPIGLMVFNPTLMFERGWEQFVGSGIYLWAVCTLARELFRLWKNEQAFAGGTHPASTRGTCSRRQSPRTSPSRRFEAGRRHR